LLLKIILHSFEGNGLFLFRMKNKGRVLAEGATKVAAWEEKDKGYFSVPIR
jgi:hypothetical protein